MTAREAAFFTGLDLLQREMEQEADITQMEQDRLQRALQAALRRIPSPEELQRAWLAWAADNQNEEMIMNDTTYNGWKNYQTWNVALWLGNDEGLYNLARECGSYKATVEALREAEITETPDEVSYNDSGLDLDALEECVRGFSA